MGRFPRRRVKIAARAATHKKAAPSGAPGARLLRPLRRGHAARPALGPRGAGGSCPAAAARLRRSPRYLTTIVPSIPGWTVQRYLNVPTRLKVFEKVSPGLRPPLAPDLKSAAVTS